MPKKLERCVEHVRAQGKSKSSAFAICVKSTGQKPHRKKKHKKKRKKNLRAEAYRKEMLEHV